MESDEVLQSLERIRTLVLDLTTPDGLIQMVDSKVMITLEKTEETVYSDRQSSVETTITPTVRGVVVYCGGSENLTVKQRVLEAVSRALGIGINKVCVTY